MYLLLNRAVQSSTIVTWVSDYSFKVWSVCFSSLWAIPSNNVVLWIIYFLILMQPTIGIHSSCIIVILVFQAWVLLREKEIEIFFFSTSMLVTIETVITQELGRGRNFRGGKKYNSGIKKVKSLKSGTSELSGSIFVQFDNCWPHYLPAIGFGMDASHTFMF